MLHGQKLRVLVIGSGGREHALYWKLMQSPHARAVFVMPGNGGIPDTQRVKNVDAAKFADVLQVILTLNIDMVVVGPEQLLVDGLGNYLAVEAPQVMFFGPSRVAAEIEGSKVFCKELCVKYGIPSALYRLVTTMDYGKRLIASWEQGKYVIKADGLCAGKGVVIPNTYDEALAALTDLLVHKKFGKAGERIIIERKLVGKECSVMALCDGQSIVPMLPARDHKRLNAGPDGLNNPNTGGMGAYAPLPDVGVEMRERIRVHILEPLVRALSAEGRPFKGVIFAGIMITDEGPMLLEVNCRFGDPETQTILPLLTSDLLPYLVACCNGTLREMEFMKWSEQKYSVCVNKVSGGYPAADFIKGYNIEGLLEATTHYHAHIFHCGTERREDRFVTSGGRVVSMVGVDETIEKARATAYGTSSLVTWPDAHQRYDIGSE